ncbi:hypothetical protein DTL42_20160 [Bremerella cremea]|uniref:Uncharacterized protein n=1 Tax=Bremerella cremea TaxID=1031537 RepID=A0A368KLS8_9BACT|nr:hypothetical protein [Bremerella cremea]RCS42147.1 hypothetical protein DTL42_20160 [Bremerella cremea]
MSAFNRLLATFPLLFSLLTSTALAQPGGEEPREGVIIKIRLCEQPAGAKYPTILAQPMLQTLVGQPAQIRVGGSLKSQFYPSMHEMGLKLNVVATKHDDKRYAVKADLVRGRTLGENDPDTEIFTTETLQVRMLAENGQLNKIAISPSKWCELTLFTPQGYVDFQEEANRHKPHPAGTTFSYSAKPTVSTIPPMIARPETLPSSQ